MKSNESQEKAKLLLTHCKLLSYLVILCRLFTHTVESPPPLRVKALLIAASVTPIALAASLVEGYSVLSLVRVSNTDIEIPGLPDPSGLERPYSFKPAFLCALYFQD